MRLLIVLSLFVALPAFAQDSADVVGPTGLRAHPAAACGEWVDTNQNGKRDKSERTELYGNSESFGFSPDRKPDEVRTERVDGKTVQTRVWRYKAGEDAVVEQGETIDESEKEVRDAAGRILERSYTTSEAASSGFEQTFEYAPDGQLSSSNQTGPGNTEVWTTYTFDDAGLLISVSWKAQMGACCNSGSDVTIVREGDTVVRLVEDSFEEEGDGSGDFRETSREPRTRVATFEYDDAGRLVAKHQIVMTDPATYYTMTTRYLYVCD